MLASPRNILLQITNRGVAELKKVTPKASGKTRRRIKGKAVKAARGWSMLITVPNHWLFTITGRGPGNMPPVDRLQDWVSDVGLDASPWAVAVSIAENGTLLWQRGGNKDKVDKIFNSMETEALERLEVFYKSLVENSIEKEIAEL